MVVFGLAVLLLLLLTAIFAPWLAPYDPYTPGVAGSLTKPTAQHPLGSDILGRDTLSRLIYGSRTALTVGFVSVAIASVVGITLGLVAGFFGGFLNMFIMRAIDAFMCFPMILLALVIAALPADLTCPVLIVQHMPPMFTESLAERLNNLSALTVVEAGEGDIPVPGGVYIAPGGKHMILRKTYQGAQVKLELHLVNTPPVNSCRPSVDVLFKSVSRVMDENILAVIMTGMGNDGCNGVQMLKEKGAYCIIQDEKTSVVWGMPQEVYNLGLANEVLPLDQIGPRISQIVMKRL